MRTTIPLAITFVVGTIFALEFFVPHHALRETVDTMGEWGAVLAAAPSFRLRASQ